MKSITDVQKMLNNIPNINSGGCGIASLAMYRWLKKNNKLNKNTKFIYLHHNMDYNYYSNKKALNADNTVIPGSCEHVLLYHRGYYRDSKSSKKILNKPSYKILETTNENFILQSVNNVFDWNHKFDRKKIKGIEKTLDINLSDVKID